jgi:uncharacterized membrane protein YadS
MEDPEVITTESVGDQVVIDRASGQLSDLWKKEDYWAIWLGFIAASIVFSLMYQGLGKDAGHVLIDKGAIAGMSKIFRGWFFCLAFASIGLATNFRELKSYFRGGKPLILYVCGQSFNLVLTLLMAYLMFYKVFPEITARI